MLTLVQSKDAVPLLDIYAVPARVHSDKQQSARKKRVGTVYWIRTSRT